MLLDEARALLEEADAELATASRLLMEQAAAGGAGIKAAQRRATEAAEARWAALALVFALSPAATGDEKKAY